MSTFTGNNRWHKRCFKCCLCNKFLNPSNCNVYQGFLFCKHCLQEVSKYGRPQTYYDTTSIKPASNHYEQQNQHEQQEV